MSSQRLPDGQIARALGVSRSTARRMRVREGIPAVRKPSPVADRIVEAITFLGGAHPSGEVQLVELLNYLSPATFPSSGHRHMWRRDTRAQVSKLVGSRLERVRVGVYRLAG